MHMYDTGAVIFTAQDQLLGAREQQFALDRFHAIVDLSLIHI